MASLGPVSDSTDWLPTPLRALAPLESSLRCQVCKDFFNTPMITSCSHTFCSLCIRRYLSQEGRCPACRTVDQESKLRRNWAVEELVSSFVGSRKDLMDFARATTEAAQGTDVEQQRPKKRRKLEGSQTSTLELRNTRSQSRRNAVQASQESTENQEEEFIADSEGGSEYENGPESSLHFTPRVSEPEDGLVACPGCGKRMKAEVVFTHLDTCASSGSSPTLPLQANGGTKPASKAIAYPQASAPKQKERLPTLAYSILNENALRKKLKELGISNLGPKLLMQKRHTEWVNLWNANCDSRNPRSKRDLLSDLETWEKTQGRQIASNLGPSGVMSKDFDSDDWAKSNKTDFDDLIRKARERKAEPAVAKVDEEDHTLPSASAVPRVPSPTPQRHAFHKGSEPTLTHTNGTARQADLHATHATVDLMSPAKPASQDQQQQSSQRQHLFI